MGGRKVDQEHRGIRLERQGAPQLLDGGFVLPLKQVDAGFGIEQHHGGRARIHAAPDGGLGLEQDDGSALSRRPLLLHRTVVCPEEAQLERAGVAIGGQSQALRRCGKHPPQQRPGRESNQQRRGQRPARLHPAPERSTWSAGAIHPPRERSAAAGLSSSQRGDRLFFFRGERGRQQLGFGAEQRAAVIAGRSVKEQFGGLAGGCQAGRQFRPDVLGRAGGTPRCLAPRSQAEQPLVCFEIFGVGQVRCFLFSSILETNSLRGFRRTSVSPGPFPCERQPRGGE